MAKNAMGEVLITEQMIKAGVDVYSNPGRYETYDETVIRIFCAMLSASGVEGLDKITELGVGEVHRIGFRKPLDRPSD